ncbi:MAG: ribosome recycling factor [Candidatus Neomarinimicrobiota bacterium]|nr:ribosome recycling factor [Candidatus Neomarinimicrobiota bacterium]MCD6101366.1 ribosome recycling factor [Candidatus Neomarinimicrobiota bacterium]RKY43476.1 MAG: ribosome recycling factor [Candidatus Neomarinimicrobiota bacterium]RKY49774.1 MAG: ribosome recycling factor [Candidatus Neomarinimicrobiota bacterium]RKY51034.1 MAG: ribosome recycling factor [Candidatus Neomarinimicrobiota bacterium]
MIEDILKDAEERMKKSLENTRHELLTIRTGRATPTLLDGVKVEYYGSMVPLKQVANVVAPEARLLVVNPYDRSALPAIEKAIIQANLGLNPMNDGNVIRIPIPPLTEERRQELVKLAHKLCEDGRIAVRNIRRDANDMVKDLKKDHEISEDEAEVAFEKIQKLTDKYIDEINTMLKSKEKELLEE